MKKLFSLVFLSAAISFTACGQKLDASKVPAPVKTAFAKQYPRTAVRWELEDGKYEAAFKQQGHEISVLYDANGTMSESEMEIKASELPAAVTSYIKTHHQGATIKEAARITKANGEINYEAVVVKGTDLIFDVNGNFLKEAKD